jgi:hypothetical protein
MNPRVSQVQPLTAYRLLLTFTSGEERIFDMTPYLDKGIFTSLRDPAYFNAVRAVGGSIAWPDEQDLCPDTLYELSSSVAGRQAA